MSMQQGVLRVDRTDASVQGSMCWPAVEIDTMSASHLNKAAPPPKGMRREPADAQPVVAVAEAVKKAARQLYFGIRADVQSTNLEEWPCYKVVDALTQELNGCAVATKRSAYGDSESSAPLPRSACVLAFAVEFL